MKKDTATEESVNGILGNRHQDDSDIRLLSVNYTIA